jgi:Putative transposase
LLNCAGPAAAFQDRQWFSELLGQLRKEKWVVYAKPPFGGPAHVLRYLGRYTHRIAISNHRLTSFDGQKVTFRWRDYAHGNKQRVMTLDAVKFLRRFFLHVLPKGFVRIRRYGLLSNRFRAESLPLARRLLALEGRPPLPTAMPAADNAPLWHCPRCAGRMRVAHRFTATELAFIRELDSS